MGDSFGLYPVCSAERFLLPWLWCSGDWFPPVQLLLRVPIVLGPPGPSWLWDVCWSSYSEWQASPRDYFFKATFFKRVSSVPKLFMQSTAKTIRCTAIQEIRVIALRVCKADKPQEQSLRAGCSGSGSKGSLFGFIKNCSPDQAPPGCITKDQNKQVQICAAAPYFPYGALCSF